MYARRSRGSAITELVSREVEALSSGKHRQLWRAIWPMAGQSTKKTTKTTMCPLTFSLEKCQFLTPNEAKSNLDYNLAEHFKQKGVF